MHIPGISLKFESIVARLELAEGKIKELSDAMESLKDENKALKCELSKGNTSLSVMPRFTFPPPVISAPSATLPSSLPLLTIKAIGNI